jgi:hypothetical protein
MEFESNKYILSQNIHYLDLRKYCSLRKLAGLTRLVRPVGPTGQTGVIKFHEILFGLDHWIGLIEYIKIHVERQNRSPDEGDMTSPRSTRHSYWSDRCPSPVRPVPPRFRAKLRSPNILGL